MDTDLSAPSLARQTVRKALAGLGVDGQLAEDILLVTSELVSNAVEHGGGCDRLEIDHSDDQVTIRVYDRNTIRPEPRVAAPLAPRSRGLRLVDALAPLWDSEVCDGGKYVWARFPRAKTTP